MKISDIFEKGAQSHTYRRIESDYKVNIFLGYNDFGQMSMVITEPGIASYVKSSKLINVSLSRREDGKMALTFDLLDNSFSSMFIIFCKDIIEVCEKGGPSYAISNALVRWKYWKEMFGKTKNSILEKREIKGLIGELIELRDHFLRDYDEKSAVACWMGPLAGHKDFEIADTWYEVKSVNENAIQVQISSLEQLESDIDGHLVVVRLEDTSEASYNALNLNSVVASVFEKLEDAESRELFTTRLDNMGYTFSEDYEVICFSYKGTEYYSVKEGFPRLTRGNVEDGIGNASYTIILGGISKYREV